MMIEKIRDKIKKSVGERHKFRFNGSRNQIEEFEGTISNSYPVIFTIEINESTVKSFSYSDILTNNLEIID